MGHAKQDEESVAPQTTAQFATDDDYISRAPWSVARAASEGDRAAEARRESPFRLPAIQFDAGYATGMAAQFRDGEQAYLTGHGKKTDEVYRDFDFQARGYETDAGNIAAADRYYANLVPFANVAFDSVVRYETIRGTLDIDPFDSDWPDQRAAAAKLAHDGATHLGDRSNTSAEAMRESKGMVSDAARALVHQHHNMTTEMLSLYAFTQRTLAKALELRRTAAAEDLAKIEEEITRCTDALGVIDKILGWSAKGASHAAVETEAAMKHEHIIEDPTGAASAGRGFNSAAAVGGVVQGAVGIGLRAFHQSEISELTGVIGRLGSAVAAAEERADKADQDKSIRNVTNAIDAYTSAALKYDNAVASRRTQYVNAGAQADLAQHRGHLAKGDDKVSQSMLVISAARETRLNLAAALDMYAPGHDLNAPTPLLVAARGFAHRSRGYATSNVVVQQAERQEHEDQLAIKRAYNLTAKWADATQEELVKFDKLEARSRSMLHEVGGITGEY